MFNHVKNKLQQTGELMVKTSDGEEFELHLHNVEFDEDNKLIEIDAGNTTYWLNGDEIIYMWVHRVKG